MARKEADKHELCHLWIVEYACWRMWTTFAKFGMVDYIPNWREDAPGGANDGDGTTAMRPPTNSARSSGVRNRPVALRIVLG